jgi:hypothetical protein
MRQEDVSWILHQALKQPLRIAKHQDLRGEDYKNRLQEGWDGSDKGKQPDRIR